MTSTEKIANAQKRIEELQRLIRHWNNSEEEVSKNANFSLKLNK